jgi:hypothetical protein
MTSAETVTGAWKTLQEFVRRFPRSSDEVENVSDWWPLHQESSYWYRVSEVRRDVGSQWVGIEFLLSIRQDAQDETRYHFDVQGFDEFPYTGLKIRNNRVSVFTQFEDHIIEEPLLTFPLREQLVYADEQYEYTFLKTQILETTDKLLYAPVRNNFWCVEAVHEPIFELRRCEGGKRMIFQKGNGIVQWPLSGGYVVRQIPSIPSLDEAQNSWITYRNSLYGFSLSYPASLAMTSRHVDFFHIEGLVFCLELVDKAHPNTVVLRIMISEPFQHPLALVKDAAFLQKVCKTYKEFILGGRQAITCVTCGSAACGWKIVLPGTQQIEIFSMVLNGRETEQPEDQIYPIRSIISTMHFEQIP